MSDSRKVPELCTNFHRASELIGRRWSGAIIYVLLKSRCRFATLREAIPDITDRMLSERLQELEHCGIVERTVIPETPVRVEDLADEEGAGADARREFDCGVGGKVERGRGARAARESRQGPPPRLTLRAPAAPGFPFRTDLSARSRCASGR